MRTIKFRAWDKKNNVMRDVLDILFGGTYFDFRLLDPTPTAPQNWITLKKEDVELMQFTGLCDKDGKEIFEGDIVQYNYGDYKDSMKITVAYHEKSASFSLPTDYDGEVVQLEIIGNAHENPELLTP